MSVLLKTGAVEITQPDGTKQTINVLVDESKEQAVAEINSLKTQTIAAIEQKKNDTLDEIPDDYTELNESVNELKEDLEQNYVNTSKLSEVIGVHEKVNLLNPDTRIKGGYYNPDGYWIENEDFCWSVIPAIPDTDYYLLKPNGQTNGWVNIKVLYYDDKMDKIGSATINGQIHTTSDKRLHYVGIPMWYTYFEPVGEFLYAVISEGYQANQFIPHTERSAIEDRLYNIEKDIRGSHWNGKKWYAYGTSITDVGAGTGKYVPYLAKFSGLDVVNKGVAGAGIGDLGAYSKGQNYTAICNTTDGKTEADLITLETGANDTGLVINEAIGDIYDTGRDTLCGCLNDCIRFLQANTNAQIVIMPSPSSTNVPTSSSHQYYEWRLKMEQICKINSVHFIAADSGLGFAKYNATGNKYVVDSIHQTELGGYVLAENMWSQLKSIPLFRAEIPTA